MPAEDLVAGVFALACATNKAVAALKPKGSGLGRCRACPKNRTHLAKVVFMSCYCDLFKAEGESLGKTTGLADDTHEPLERSLCMNQPFAAADLSPRIGFTMTAGSTDSRRRPPGSGHRMCLKGSHALQAPGSQREPLALNGPIYKKEQLGLGGAFPNLLTGSAAEIYSAI